MSERNIKIREILETFDIIASSTSDQLETSYYSTFFDVKYKCGANYINVNFSEDKYTKSVIVTTFINGVYTEFECKIPFYDIFSYRYKLYTKYKKICRTNSIHENDNNLNIIYDNIDSFKPTIIRRRDIINDILN